MRHDWRRELRRLALAVGMGVIAGDAERGVSKTSGLSSNSSSMVRLPCGQGGEAPARCETCGSDLGVGEFAGTPKPGRDPKPTHGEAFPLGNPQQADRHATTSRLRCCRSARVRLIKSRN